MTTTGAPTRDAVRVALIELLSTDEHHDAATPATLGAVAKTRRDLAALHGLETPPPTTPPSVTGTPR